MNPATAELHEAIEEARAPEVVVLPNNGNVILSAEQAASLATKPVHVIHADSIPAGLAAMVAFDPSAFEDPPNPVSEIQMQDLIGRLIDNGTVPEPDQDVVPSIYVVFLPNQVHGSTLSHPAARGAHGFMSSIDWDDLDYAYVPVMWVGNEGTPDAITSVFSHELVETLTDPEADGWQIDPRDRPVSRKSPTSAKPSKRSMAFWSGSYRSNEDNACVVPIRAYTIYTVQWIWRPRRIEWLGGVDEEQVPWQLPRQAVMDRLRQGDRLKGLRRQPRRRCQHLLSGCDAPLPRHSARRNAGR